MKQLVNNWVRSTMGGNPRRTSTELVFSRMLPVVIRIPSINLHAFSAWRPLQRPTPELRRWRRECIQLHGASHVALRCRPFMAALFASTCLARRVLQRRNSATHKPESARHGKVDQPSKHAHPNQGHCKQRPTGPRRLRRAAAPQEASRFRRRSQARLQTGTKCHRATPPSPPERYPRLPLRSGRRPPPEKA